MSDNLSVQGEGSVGDPWVLVSDGDKNHSAEDYAKVTAEMIFLCDNVTEEVRDLQDKAIVPLAHFFSDVIGIHKVKLAANQSDEFSTFHALHGVALEAAAIAKELADISGFAHVTARLGWLEEITKIIGTNLATAVHVENLLHADRIKPGII